MMYSLVSSFCLVSFLLPSVAGFGVRLPTQSQLTSSATTTTTTTTLGALPIDATTPIDITNAAQSMWVATIDSDIANIQLEEFRLVFAGGLAVMFGGLISTTLLGTLIDKKEGLYADLAVESYIDMADDPDFWRKMTEGMSPEEQEKAKELMAKIKAQREGDETPATNKDSPISSSSASDGGEASGSTEATTPAPVEAAAKGEETAKASNDMFSDY